MEPIAHLEWTLGIGLICLAILDMSIDAFSFLLLGIGAVFPDIFDVVVFHGKKFEQGHREFSHTIFFLIVLLVFAIIVPILSFLFFGTILHLIEDIVSGGNPIYLFSPLTHRGSIVLITKDQSIQIGGMFRNIIRGSFTGSENIGDELSWLWLLTILGTWILMLGILLYFG